MNHKQALKCLGLEGAPEAASIESAYAQRQYVLEKKRDEAPTDTLREKIERALQQLDQARELLLAEASGDESTPASGASNSSRPASPLSETKMADLPSARQSATRIGDDTAGAAVDLSPGDVLAERYEIVDRIGAGGMGAVYHAKDRTRDEDVALKVLLPGMVGSSRARDRFLDEARLSSKLSHPGIVNVYDVQQDGDYVFLSMELLEGQDLRALLDTRQLSRQEFDETEAKQLGRALCEALGYAHEHTVHRDIKPENVWVTEDGQYKLMDFGIARVMSNSERTKTGMAMGTAYYMAPEQLKGTGSVDGRADQYALAVLLYEVLTGEVPAGRIKPLREKRSDLSKGFAASIDRALEPDPEDRFADMEEFGKALASGKAKARKRKGRPSTTTSAGGPGWLPWAGGIAAVLAVAVVFGGNLMGARDAFMGLFPDPQAEARALALDGEISTLSDRLEAREESFRQRLDDAERRVSGLERDLRNADDASEEQQLEAELERARTELEYAESIVDLGRSAIFESDLYTETASAQSIGERKLRNEDWEAADKALSQAQSGLTTLLDRAEGLPELVPTRAEALETKREWARSLEEAGFTGSELSEAINALYEQANTFAASGSFGKAAGQYEQAAAKANQVHQLITRTRPKAFQAKQSWRNAAKSADLVDDQVAGQIETLYRTADEQLAANELKTARKTYSEARALAAEAEVFAKAASSGSVAEVAAYVETYSDGAYAEQADGTSWSHARKQGSLVAYKAYIQEFPGGEHIGAAKDRIDAIEEKRADARAATKQRAEDDAAWELAQSKHTVASYREYLNEFPGGRHVAGAKKAVDTLEAEQRAQERRLEDKAWEKATQQHSLESYNDFLEEYPSGQHATKAKKRKVDIRNVLNLAALSAEVVRASGAVFRFTDIPAGRFVMGGNESDEKPKHGVVIKPFLMQEHEVTLHQWDACVSDDGCTAEPGGEFRWRDDQPVTGVSAREVETEFIPWLERQTGDDFRLPTEAEWEYAARAGTTTKYFWGDDIGDDNANCNGCGSKWDDQSLSPVKSFSENQFGLYDMHGNVWEWTRDCYHDSYTGAPFDGTAWRTGNCDLRVVRGGSWKSSPSSLEASNRRGLAETFGGSVSKTVFKTYIGFRLVKE